MLTKWQVLGNLHPQALGARLHDVWGVPFEDQVMHLIDEVVNTGISVNLPTTTFSSCQHP